MNGYERISAMLQNREVDRLPLLPITMMFAADRIGAKYGDYVKDYRILAEAQIRTAEMFDIDAVSVISDPAREAADLGADIQYFEDQPPAIKESNALLADKSKLLNLRCPDPAAGGPEAPPAHWGHGGGGGCSCGAEHRSDALFPRS